MSGLALKDFLPLIGTAITVITGYILISVQINKNRRSKWVEEFRKEVASFIGITTALHAEWTNDKLFKMYSSLHLLCLYLEESQSPESIILIRKLNDLQSITLHANLKSLETFRILGERTKEIRNLASEIIIKEKRKI